jgi:hypothetical protein
MIKRQYSFYLKLYTKLFRIPFSKSCALLVVINKLLFYMKTEFSKLKHRFLSAQIQSALNLRPAGEKIMLKLFPAELRRTRRKSAETSSRYCYLILINPAGISADFLRVLRNSAGNKT